MIKEVKDKLFNIIDMSDSLVDFKGKKPEHCILPEHYSELANDLSVFVTSLLDNWISVDRELERAIKLHPDYPTDMFRQVAIMNEEAGEITKAVLHYHYENGSLDDIKTELIQTMAMCKRMLNALPQPPKEK